MQVKITPSPLAGTVQLPPSKSFAIRALICSALAGGGSVAPWALRQILQPRFKRWRIWLPGGTKFFATKAALWCAF